MAGPIPDPDAPAAPPAEPPVAPPAPPTEPPPPDRSLEASAGLWGQFLTDPRSQEEYMAMHGRVPAGPPPPTAAVALGIEPNAPKPAATPSVVSPTDIQGSAVQVISPADVAVNNVVSPNDIALGPEGTLKQQDLQWQAEADEGKIDPGAHQFYHRELQRRGGKTFSEHLWDQMSKVPEALGKAYYEAGDAAHDYLFNKLPQQIKEAPAAIAKARAAASALPPMTKEELDQATWDVMRGKAAEQLVSSEGGGNVLVPLATGTAKLASFAGDIDAIIANAEMMPPGQIGQPSSILPLALQTIKAITVPSSLPASIHNEIYNKPPGYYDEEVKPEAKKFYDERQAANNAVADMMTNQIAVASRKVAEATGQDPDDVFYKAIEMFPGFVMPIPGAEFLAGERLAAGIARMARVGVPVAKEAAKLGVGFAATRTAAMALGIEPSTLTTAAELVGAGGLVKGRSVAKKILNAVRGLDRAEVAKNTRLMMEAPGGVTAVERLSAPIGQRIDDLDVQIRHLLTQPLDDAEKAKLSAKRQDGSHVWSSDDLKGTAKEIRARQEEMADLEAKLETITKQKKFHMFTNYLGSLGANMIANTAVGAGISGVMGAVAAPTGMGAEGFAGGSVFGASIGAAFSPFAARSGMRNLRRSRGRQVLTAMGEKGFNKSSLEGVDPYWQQQVLMANGYARSMGGEAKVIDPALHADWPSAVPQGAPAGTPAMPANGMISPDGRTMYFNKNALREGVALHELQHMVQRFTGQMLRLKSPEIIEPFYEAYAKASGDPAFNVQAEMDAEIGRIAMANGPLEIFYGGEQAGDLVARLARGIVNHFVGDKVKYDPKLQAPYTPRDIETIRQQMFKIGRRAQAWRFVEPVMDSGAPPAAGGAPAGGRGPRGVVPPPVPSTALTPDEQQVMQNVMAAGKQLKMGVGVTDVGDAIVLAKQAGVDVNDSNILNIILNQINGRDPLHGLTAAAPPAAGAPAPVAAPAPAVTHPDYTAIRTQAEDAMRQKLAGSKAKTVQRDIENAGIVAAAQAHAKAVGPDSDLITWRTDKYGKTSISGKRADPNDPFHQMLIQRANLSPEAKTNLTDLEANIGRAIAVDYSHAPEEGLARPEREAARAAAGAPERVAGAAAREKLTKSYVPTGITYYPKANAFVVNGFSPDKFLSNANEVIDWAKSTGKRTYDGVNDPLLVQHVQILTDNHANGFDGAGKPIKGTALTPVEQTPRYQPEVIPKDYRDQLNVMMGNDTAKTGVKGLSPEQAEKQALAKANSPYFDPQTGETNKVRAQMGDRAKNLSPVYETLRPELIDRVRQAPVADTETLRPSGFTGDRAQLGLRGLPRQDFVAANLMPATERGAMIPKEERQSIIDDIHAGRIDLPEVLRSLGMIDNASMSSITEKLNTETLRKIMPMVDGQDSSRTNMISDLRRYVNRSRGAQLMPATRGEAMPRPVTEEETARYVDRVGVPPDRQAEASNDIQKITALNEEPSLAKPYEAPEVSPAAPRRGRGARLSRQAEASARGFEALAAEDPVALREALAANRNRISIVIPELVRGERAGFNIRGTTIAAPVDFAMAVQSIRSPWKESLKVAAVDPQTQRVIGSEIAHVGTLSMSLAYPGDIFRLFTLYKDKYPDAELWLSHNHPSGDPNPSPQDIALHHSLNEAAAMIGVRIADHVVTDGRQFYSLTRNELGDIPQPVKQPWEVKAQVDMPLLNSPDAIQEFVGTLRAEDPNAAHVFYLGSRLRLTGLERVPDANMVLRLRQQIMQGIAREAPYAIALDLPQAPDSALIDRMLAWGRNMRRPVADLSWPGMHSAVEAGVIPELRAQLQGMKEPVVHQLMPATAGFYTKSGRVIDDKMPNAADSEQVKALLRNAGIGKNEMEWLGLNDLPKGKLTKEQMQQWITAHTPEISVTTLGGGGGLVARATQYGQYTLPGGANYREILMNLPSGTEVSYRAPHFHGFGAENLIGHLRVDDRTTADGNKMLFLQEAQGDWPQEGRKRGYRTPEFIEEVKAARTKLSDLIGEKEDIIQKSAENLVWKRVGTTEWEIVDTKTGKSVPNEDIAMVYPAWPTTIRRGETSAEASRRPAVFGSSDSAREFVMTLKRNGLYSNITSEEATKLADLVQEMADQEDIINRNPVSDMPFKGEAWKKLLMRQAIKTAVEDGRDSIGWTTGQQQADRYDLSKRVDRVYATKTPDGKFNLEVGLARGAQGQPMGVHPLASEIIPNKLDEYVGRDLADKIRSQKEDLGSYEGGDLKIGGEGMKGFYDRELVNIANDIGKKFGAKVQDAQISTRERNWIVERKRVPTARQTFLPFEQEAQVPHGWGEVGGEAEPEGWKFLNSFQDRRQAETAAASYNRSKVDPYTYRVREAPPEPDTTVHELPITPQMRESVETQGQLMFMPSTHPEAMTAPAIRRIEDNKIFPAIKAFAHWGIPSEYPKELGDYYAPSGYKNYEDGYVNKDGKFFNKSDAYDVAKRIGQTVRPTQYAGEVQSNELGLNSMRQLMPSTHPDAIQEAAYEFPDGTILRGVSDLDALHKFASVYSERGHDIEIQRTRGSGEFVGEADTREEAQGNYARIIADYEGQYPTRRHYEAGAGMGDYGGAGQIQLQPATRLIQRPIPREAAEGEKPLRGLKIHRGVSVTPTGKVGVVYPDLQRALDEWSKAQGPSKTVREMVRDASAEIRMQMQSEGANGQEWYRKDVENTIQHLIENRFPQLADDTKRKLFLSMTASTSGGAPPESNLMNSLQAFGEYERTGKIPLEQLSGQEYVGYGSGHYSLQKLQHLINTKGEKGAVDWLLTKHPVAEVRAAHPTMTSNVRGHVKRGDTAYGAMALGRKLGPFLLNLNGIFDHTTVDIWGARSLRRWMGTLGQSLKISTRQLGGGRLIDMPPTGEEIRMFHEIMGGVSKKLGLTLDDAQALQWYFEHELYRAHGVGDAAQSFAGAVDKANQKYGEILRSRQDEGAGGEAPQGEEAPVVKGIPEGVQGGGKRGRGEQPFKAGGIVRPNGTYLIGLGPRFNNKPMKGITHVI